MNKQNEDHSTSDEQKGRDSRKSRGRGRKKAIKVSRMPQRDVKIKDTMSALSVPDEVLKKCSMMTVLGRQELTVEGHEGILAYETDCIRIRTGKTIVSIVGKQLVIDYYNDEELKIVGCIDQISWENR